MDFLARIRLSDAAVVLIFMFFGVAGAIPGIAPNQASEMTGTASSPLQFLAGVGSQVLIDGLMAMWLVRSRSFWARFFRTGRLRVLLWPTALGVWAAASTVWSGDPLLTVRRALPFALAALFGVFLVVRFEQRRLLTLLQIAFGLLAVCSALLALGVPSIGLDASTGHGGDWQGAFTQKNACGRAMVFALAAVLCAGRITATRAMLLGVFAGVLLLSGSRGARLLATIVVVATALLAASCRLDRRGRAALLAVFGVAAIAAAILVLCDFGALTQLLGRDATLTGRTAIWRQVWLSIEQRPLLGHGFAAFWRGASPPSWNVVVALRFVLFHAHNGFLEIWLELGAGGLLLFVAGFLRGLWLLWPEIEAGHFREAAWPFAVLLLTALYDLDENTLLAFNGLFWLLYAAALARIELLAIERSAIRRSIRRMRVQGPICVTEIPLVPASPCWAVPIPVPLLAAPAFLMQTNEPVSTARSPWL